MMAPTVTTYIPPVHVPGLPSDDVLNALVTGVVDVKRYAAIYEPDAVTPMGIEFFDGRLNDGSISVDSTRDERRVCDLTLVNDDRALDLDPDNGFWYDKILKVYWGIEYYDSFDQLARWEMQVGEFMIDTITEDYFPGVMKVTGRDYTKKCMTSQILNSIQFDPTTPVETIIKALAANAGVTKFRLPYTGLSFTEPVVFDPGTPRWEVMKRVAASVGYEIYFTPDGYLTMRPYQDPTTAPVTWAFLTGNPAGTLVKYQRSTQDSLVKNHCVVLGAPQTDSTGLSVTAFGEARNDDPASPTRISRIGDRVDIFKSQYITSTEQAQALADARLRIAALEQYNVTFESVIIPFIDGGDVVKIITDRDTDYTPTRFLLSSYGLPLGLGPMSGTARRVTLIGNNRQFGVS